MHILNDHGAIETTLSKITFDSSGESKLFGKIQAKTYGQLAYLHQHLIWKLDLMRKKHIIPTTTQACCCKYLSVMLI